MDSIDRNIKSLFVAAKTLITRGIVQVPEDISILTINDVCFKKLHSLLRVAASAIFTADTNEISDRVGLYQLMGSQFNAEGADELTALFYKRFDLDPGSLEDRFIVFTIFNIFDSIEGLPEQEE
jgi:hypothetical protein